MIKQCEATIQYSKPNVGNQMVSPTNRRTIFREELLLPFVAGKQVLDCGGIDHHFVGTKRSDGTWLHSRIAEQAAGCLGVDILHERVREINSEGLYNFVEGNVEALSFVEEFDVVVGGEIIEHVYNAGAFLDSAWRALRHDGTLILTTPNFHSLSNLLYSLLTGKEQCHPEHTCYYSRQTLTYLIERHGFQVEEFHILPRPSKRRVVQWIRSTFCGFRPCFGETLFVVAKKTQRQDKYSDKW